MSLVNKSCEKVRFMEIMGVAAGDEHMEMGVGGEGVNQALAQK